MELRKIYKSLFRLADLGDDTTAIQWSGDPLKLLDDEFPLTSVQGPERRIGRTAVGYIEAEEVELGPGISPLWTMRFDVDAQVGRRKAREAVESIEFLIDHPKTRRIPVADMLIATDGRCSVVMPGTPTWRNGIARARQFLQLATEQIDHERHDRYIQASAEE